MSARNDWHGSASIVSGFLGSGNPEGVIFRDKSIRFYSQMLLFLKAFKIVHKMSAEEIGGSKIGW